MMTIMPLVSATIRGRSQVGKIDSRTRGSAPGELSIENAPRCLRQIELRDRQPDARVSVLGREKRLARSPLDLLAHPASRVAES